MRFDCILLGECIRFRNLQHTADHCCGRSALSAHVSLKRRMAAAAQRSDVCTRRIPSKQPGQAALLGLLDGPHPSFLANNWHRSWPEITSARTNSVRKRKDCNLSNVLPCCTWKGWQSKRIVRYLLSRRWWSTPLSDRKGGWQRRLPTYLSGAVKQLAAAVKNVRIW